MLLAFLPVFIRLLMLMPGPVVGATLVFGTTVGFMLNLCFRIDPR